MRTGSLASPTPSAGGRRYSPSPDIRATTCDTDRVSVAPQLLADGARCAHLLHLGARQVQEELDEIAVDEAARLPAQSLAQSAFRSGRFGARKGLPCVAIVVERSPFGVLEAADAVHHLGHRLLQLPETPELCPANRNATWSMPGLSLNAGCFGADGGSCATTPIAPLTEAKSSGAFAAGSPPAAGAALAATSPCGA